MLAENSQKATLVKLHKTHFSTNIISEVKCQYMLQISLKNLILLLKMTKLNQKKKSQKN